MKCHPLVEPNRLRHVAAPGGSLRFRCSGRFTLLAILFLQIRFCFLTVSPGLLDIHLEGHFRRDLHETQRIVRSICPDKEGVSKLREKRVAALAGQSVLRSGDRAETEYAPQIMRLQTALSHDAGMSFPPSSIKGHALRWACAGCPQARPSGLD
jgi:hypothetical protein